MKAWLKVALILLGFLSEASNLAAQTPSAREQFQSAVAEFQRSPTEESARRLAELSRQLDPPPAVPSDARFHALKGAAFVKQASDATAFARAAGEFQAAIAVAPWIGEYHYNLTVCQKSAGQFTAALAALKFADLFARDDKERDDCLALRAELEAAQELAAQKLHTEQANSPAATEASALRKVEGATFVTHFPASPVYAPHDFIYTIKGQTLHFSVKIYSRSPNPLYEHSQPGEYPIADVPYQDGKFTFSKNGFTTTWTINSDGGLNDSGATPDFQPKRQ